MSDKIEVEGMVVDVNRDLFTVTLKNQGDALIKCTLGGRLRKNKIRILTGDVVVVELCPYETTKGRITYRGHQKP